MPSRILDRLWSSLKIQRTVSIGEVGLTFGFRRTPRLQRGRFDLRESGAGPGPHVVRPSEASTNDEITCLNATVTAEAPSRCSDVTVVIGVGPGFGYALARCLNRAGHELVLISRRTSHLDSLAQELELESPESRIHTLSVDATDERQVGAAFQTIQTRIGIPSLVVYAVEQTVPGDALSLSSVAFESCWRSNCLGAFYVCKEAAAQMVQAAKGTILIIGSTSSIVGREQHLSHAVGKFGRRALAQVMARELWPKGVHVAHVLIDADISETGCVEEDSVQSDPLDIAETLLAIHRQRRSAWTFEVDLRPWNESFWEHC